MQDVKQARLAGRIQRRLPDMRAHDLQEEGGAGGAGCCGPVLCLIQPQVGDDCPALKVRI